MLDYDATPEQLVPLLDALLSAFRAQLSAVCVPVLKVVASTGGAGIGVVGAGGDLAAETADVAAAFLLEQFARVGAYLENMALFSDVLAAKLVHFLNVTCTHLTLIHMTLGIQTYVYIVYT